MFCEGTVVKWCLADFTVQRIGFVNDVLWQKVRLRLLVFSEY